MPHPPSRSDVLFTYLFFVVANVCSYNDGPVCIQRLTLCHIFKCKTPKQGYEMTFVCAQAFDLNFRTWQTNRAAALKEVGAVPLPTARCPLSSHVYSTATTRRRGHEEGCARGLMFIHGRRGQLFIMRRLAFSLSPLNQLYTHIVCIPCFYIYARANYRPSRQRALI